MPYTSIIKKLPAELQPAIHELIETLRQEWQEQTLARVAQQLSALAEAQRRTEERVHHLAEAQEQTGALVRQLAEAQERTEQRLHRLAEAQERTEQRVNELAETQRALAETQRHTEERIQQLAEAQERTEQRLDRLEQTVAELVEAVAELRAAVAELRAAVQGLLEHQRRMQDQLAEHTGILLEWRYRDRPYAYLGRVLRRVRSVPWDELEPQLEQRLSDEQLEEVALLDVVVRGRPKQDVGRDPLWVAIEVSGVVDRHDVERALRRTELLRHAGYPVVAAVAGREVTEGGRQSAQQQAVALIQDGSIEFWDAALQKALSA